LYDSSGNTVGSWSNITSSSGNKCASRTVTFGQEYYIKVTPYSSSYSGAYQIAFNTTLTSLGVTLTTLTVNTWADGNIPTDGEQWFKFTATASTQYIHVTFGTLTDLRVQWYDSSGNIGSQSIISGSSGYTGNISRIVTFGQEYYIKVTPYNSSYSGAYQIAFNATLYPPGVTPTTLTVNTWANGNIPTSSGEQWFKFIATTATQYIHASFGTLTGLYVQLYDSSGNTVGSSTNLYSVSTTKNIYRTVTVGQEYYIKILPNNSSYSGTYWIAFNTTVYPPGVTPTTLTISTWANGNILTSDDGQWFKFTATAATQYIHVTLGTLTYLYVQVYNSSSGNTVGEDTNLHGSIKNISRTVTVGQEYYIKVYSGAYGTYQIAFDAKPYPPGVTPTTLTISTWANGNIPTSDDVQWFKFTVTAATQYIHADFGTLTSLYVQVYDSSSGNTVGEDTNLHGGTKYISRNLTVGREYFIRVSPSYGNSGTYKIAFNTNATPPAP